MEITQLLALADEALSSSGNSEEIIDKVAAYAEALELWQSAYADQSSKQQASEADLKLLSERHAQVMALADKMKSETGHAIKSMKRKGKAIMAYVDQLPRSIGISKGRKG